MNRSGRSGHYCARVPSEEAAEANRRPVPLPLTLAVFANVLPKGRHARTAGGGHHDRWARQRPRLSLGVLDSLVGLRPRIDQAAIRLP
jgi:hypothetical protein